MSRNGLLAAVVVLALLWAIEAAYKPGATPTNAVTRTPAATVPPTPALSPSSFVILSSRAVWKQVFFYAIGEVKNNGSVAADVQIEVIARDAKGVLVDSGKFWVYGANIPPGDSTGFDYLVTWDKTAVSLDMKVISARVW